MESKIEKTFTFTDEFYFGDSKDKPCCETKMTVIDKISNNSPVYVINYEHQIITPHKRSIILSIEDLIVPCPFAFFKDENVRECFEGVIVIKNPMTTSMINMIMMDDKELEKYSGNSTAQSYRRNIVNITNFGIKFNEKYDY